MQIQNVTITHRKDNRLLLDHFTLSIQRGDTFAVIGESRIVAMSFCEPRSWV